MDVKFATLLDRVLKPPGERTAGAGLFLAGELFCVRLCASIQIKKAQEVVPRIFHDFPHTSKKILKYCTSEMLFTWCCRNACD